MGDAPAAAAPASAAGKRRRGDEGAGLRRVAEIVMVLAAAGEVRGGREPTAAERALVAEARERLSAAVAGGAVRPKDLFPGEAVRAVVEDLGLNRAKDPAAMGFRPPKASIADRLMLTKRKMEEVKEAPAQPTISTPQTIVSSGMSEFHGFNGASKFGVGAPRNPPAVAALAATAPLSSASLVALKPPGSSPVRPVANSSVVALPYSGPSHLKLEKDVNGPLNLARSGATIVYSNKSTQDTSARSNVNVVQSSNQLVKNQDTKPVAGNPVTGHRATPGVAFVPPKPTFANHNEIAKNVQQFLHQPTNHPSWTPPSTEYMHARLGCQMCKVAIIDADSLLVCDACERGVHLKCLQQYGNKGVPKAEWHCSACLTQSKGKPLPPKYGKVTRTVVASKAAPPVGGAQLSVQGSAENMAAKENHHKLAANGNLMKPISTQAGSILHNSNVLALSASTASSQSQLVSTLIGNAIKAETSSNEKEGTELPSSSTTQHNMKSPPNKRLRSGFSLNSVDSANDIMHGKQTSEMSGVKCPDNSFAVGAEAKIKSEAHSEPLPSRDEEMVDNSGTSLEQTCTVATEEKHRVQATFGPDEMKDAETTTDTGTSTDQGSDFPTEENLHSEATSEPHTINDVEMATNTGIPIEQSSSVAIEEKLQTDSEPHTVQDMEMGTNSAPQIDQSSNLATEEKPQSEPTSAISDLDLANAGIPTDQTQRSNGSTENGVKEPPSGEANEDKSGCNAASDHGSTQKVVPNGILCPENETLCVHEKEAVGVSAEAKEEVN
ncbi:PHD finger protein At3g20280-like [Phragmites australis]|uniref:PHD finger protein At3g20280-like n=1 Tax=Phragmites australis TaxID=29695 RepID=UPI002D76BEE3|nr:PHD finger protein At3g20280-like [Phragmites australis]XP_062222183.1 PHD finger protein At3g20280-like [Phragmites australis]